MIKLYGIKMKSGHLCLNPNTTHPLFCPVEIAGKATMDRILELLKMEHPETFKGAKIIILKEQR